MRTRLDCVWCMGRQALDAARAATSDPRLQQACMDEVLRRSLGCPLDRTPAEHSMTAYRVVRELTGVADPYAEEKRRQNEAALALEDEVERLVDAEPDPLRAAVLASLAGNIIDLGTGQTFDIAEEVDRFLHVAPAHDDYAEFAQALSRAGRVLFAGDNAGEIVFDKPLVRRLAPAEVVYAVKGGPIINDATMDDALAVGMDRLARIVTTGCDAVGAPLHVVGPEFLEELAAADLVISKGQGNLETLDEADADVFFLLKAKCPCVARRLGVGLGDTVIARKGNLPPD